MLSRLTLLVLMLVLSLTARAQAPASFRSVYTLAIHSGVANAEKIRSSLADAGFGTALVSDADIADSGKLSPETYDAVVFPDGALCPIRGKNNLLRFLRGGGSMVVVGGPLFETSVEKAKQARETRLAALPIRRTVIDLTTADLHSWRRASSNMPSKTTWTIEQSGPPGTPATLHVTMPDLTGWDTLQLPIAGAYSPGDDMTMFWAKGGPRTTGMTVEIQERDGSRWIAAVPLTTQWKRVVLPPEEFRYWQDNPSKGRGGTGDQVHPENAATMAIGIAQSHVNVPAGRHEFWLAGVGAGTLPTDLQAEDLTLPTLELFSPFYKYYRLPSLHPTTSELRRAAETGNQSGPIVTPIPRPRGLGFESARRGRWIPLDSIRSEEGRVVGTRASLWVNLQPPYRGSVWAQIAEGDVVPAVRRMAVGLFLARAGAAQFSYFADETVPLGCEVANVRPIVRKAEVRMTVYRGADHSHVVHQVMLPVSLPGNSDASTQGTSLVRPAPGSYTVVTELMDGKTRVDEIVQPISVLESRRQRDSAFVRVQRGTFLAPVSPPLASRNTAAKPWYPYGINYWQSNVAGADVREYALHWLAPAYYDPDIVERDLTTLQSLSFTSISIQLGNPDHIRQANDVIHRAAIHGMKTNLFIGGAHPFQTDERLFTRLITEGRFATNPNVWAYDIAWEHHLGSHDERTSWDRDWESWIVERYGTIAHAEKSWGYPVPRDAAGRVTNPPDAQLRGDGPWLKMANAYSRCADDVIARRYAAVIRKIKAIDPNHLVSARSASQPSWVGWFGYDLVSCGKAFDFSSPEGYGLKPEEGGFTVAYGRWAGNGKPVFWAEFGVSIFPYDTTGDTARRQADLHRGFARMLLDSGANGLASWWSVGGYRVDERTDFGIIAPDGTPRSAARALQERAKAVVHPRSTRPPTTWVTIDRDLHAAAYDAVYSAHKQSYTAAVKAGGMVGVRTAGTGTTSANVPLTCVGNLPYDGFSPLKYMNAEFYKIEIRNACGSWVEVPDGGTVEVTSGKPIVARIAAGNLGEAKWLATGKSGVVRLIGDDRPDARSGDRPRLTFAAAIPHDIARYENISLPAVTLSMGILRDSEAELTFEAAARARFGQRRLILLKARP